MESHTLAKQGRNGSAQNFNSTRAGRTKSKLFGVYNNKRNAGNNMMLTMQNNYMAMSAQGN